MQPTGPNHRTFTSRGMPYVAKFWLEPVELEGNYGFSRRELHVIQGVMANSIARIVGRCLGKGESLPRESVEGEYRLYTYTAGGLDYVVKVRPNTTISVELNLRATPP